MKLNYLLVLLCSFGLLQAQNKKKVDFSKLDRSGMKTSLLLTDAKPFSILAQEGDTYGMYGFQQSYQELGASDTQKRFPNNDLIKSEMKMETTNEIIKIGLIHTDFEIISKKAYDEGLIKINNNQVTRNSNNYIFDQYSNTIIAPLTLRKKGVQTTFMLDSKIFTNTTSNKITSIKADFNDGKGFIEFFFDRNISVTYPTEGKKEITFEISFENGYTKTRKSSLIVNYSNEDAARLFQRATSLITSTRNPDLAIYGATDFSPGKCEYEVFLSPDGILDKPIFVVDGFDPSDSRNITAVYNLLTYTDAGGVIRNLGDRIRNEEGFDVVIVNFPNYTNAANNIIDGGADFIERNALSLVNVIELINTQKTGTEQNVVIGPSMGGLITRYALRYMEQNSLNHQTRLWVSFDSPHYGANVPIGLQHLFNYFAYGYGDVDAVKPLVEGMLRSPAAKQMLVDHFESHITTAAITGANPIAPSTGMPLLPTGATNIRNNFQNRMNVMGFPQNTRNVSMINGSGSLAKFKDISNADVNPGFDLIGTAASPTNIDTGTVSGLNTRAQTFCEFMPTANTQEKIAEVKIQAQIFFWTTMDTFTATAKQSLSSDGVDSSPGGLFDVFGLASSLGGDPILTNFMGALKCGYFSFIPAVSSMGLNVGGVVANNQPNYYHNIVLGSKDTPWDGVNTATSNTTPFKSWYMPTTNEGHVKVTQGHVDFAWCEIVKPDYNFALNSQNSVVTCNGNNASFTFDYNNIHGCLPNPTTFTTSGSPAGALVTFTPNSISANGTVTLNVSNITPGTYTIMVTPDNNSLKTIPVSITINPSNPNLNGMIQFSTNNGSTFNQAASVTVTEGSDLELKLPSNLYNGTIEWFDPAGNSRGSSNPVISSIVNNSNDEGFWNAKVTFTNDCARMAPSNISFEVIVETVLDTNQSEFLGLNIYPNPTRDLINIVANTDLNTIQTKIIDLRGRIMSDKKPTVLSTNNAQVDISNLSQGTYFLIIENSENRTVKKIIKQ